MKFCGRNTADHTGVAEGRIPTHQDGELAVKQVLKPCPVCF